METSEWITEWVETSVNIPASWSVQTLRKWPGTQSGPVTFRKFTLRKGNLTIAAVIVGAGTPEAVGSIDIIQSEHSVQTTNICPAGANVWTSYLCHIYRLHQWSCQKN